MGWNDFDLGQIENGDILIAHQAIAVARVPKIVEDKWPGMAARLAGNAAEFERFRVGLATIIERVRNDPDVQGHELSAIAVAALADIKPARDTET